MNEEKKKKDEEKLVLSLLKKLDIKYSKKNKV